MEVLEKDSLVMQLPVAFTESAVTEIRRLMKEQQTTDDRALRVGVKGGGCSGMTYVLEFDKRQENDQEFSIGGIPVILNQSHELYLYGMTVDFEHGLNARGFVFHNPNAKTTCGCGTSFSA